MSSGDAIESFKRTYKSMPEYRMGLRSFQRIRIPSCPGLTYRGQSVPEDESPHPLAEFTGMFRDDPHFEEWQEAIREYRRSVDEDDTAP